MLDDVSEPGDLVDGVEVTWEDELDPVADPVLLPEDAVRVVEELASFWEAVFACALLVLCEELDPIPVPEPLLLLAVACDE